MVMVAYACFASTMLVHKAQYYVQHQRLLAGGMQGMHRAMYIIRQPAARLGANDAFEVTDSQHHMEFAEQRQTKHCTQQGHACDQTIKDKNSITCSLTLLCE
jgi:hypothetical protein